MQIICYHPLSFPQPFTETSNLLLSRDHKLGQLLHPSEPWEGTLSSNSLPLPQCKISAGFTFPPQHSPLTALSSHPPVSQAVLSLGGKRNPRKSRIACRVLALRPSPAPAGDSLAFHWVTVSITTGLGAGLQRSAGLSRGRFVRSLEPRIGTGGTCHLSGCQAFHWE